MTSSNYLVGGKLKIWICKQAIDTEPDYQVTILLCCYIYQLCSTNIIAWNKVSKAV